MVETVTEIDTLHRTNEQLSQDNARLAAENARTKELERQNELLTALLEVKGSLGFSTVAASVIGRESAQFRRVLTVDVGTDRGVREGDVVVGPGGALVGRVTSVTGNSATILLINDPSSTVIGQLGANQATGSVIGQLGGVLVMENIDSAERLQIGDTVTTAGIDLGGGVRSPFPKGLLVGSVVDVARDANAVTQTAFIQPATDLDRLEYVLVVTDYEGGLPPVDQQPIPCAVRRHPARRRPALRDADGRSRDPRRRPGALLRYEPMKGIVLAGGTATRLFPLTIVTNKHLLPIYDRPMIYYPIETLAGMGIREVMVVVGGKSVGDVVELLGDGSHFGLDLTYRYQRGALGIAHAIGLARDFVGDEPFCCVLGDNILRGPALAHVAREFEAGPWGAGTLLYRVPDPERFGVAELDAGRQRRRLRGEARRARRAT